MHMANTGPYHPFKFATLTCESKNRITTNSKNSTHKYMLTLKSFTEEGEHELASGTRLDEPNV